MAACADQYQHKYWHQTPHWRMVWNCYVLHVFNIVTNIQSVLLAFDMLTLAKT